MYIYVHIYTYIHIRPKIEKLHFRRHELLFFMHSFQTLLILEGTIKNPAKEDFVAFQVRFLHSCADIFVNIYRFIYVCIYIYIYTYIYIHKYSDYTCMYINPYMHIYIYTFTHKGIYAYSYINTCTQPYIYIHTKKHPSSPYMHF